MAKKQSQPRAKKQRRRGLGSLGADALRVEPAAVPIKTARTNTPSITPKTTPKTTPSTTPITKDTGHAADNASPTNRNTRGGTDGKPTMPTTTGDAIVHIPIRQIVPNRYQPRVHFDQNALASLAASIQTDGLMQPVIVRATDAPDRYELIAGERRWRAAQLIPLDEIPAIVRQASDQQAMLLALIENIQREDLSVLEEAAAVEQLIIKFDLTQAQAAKAIGRSRPAVTNLLRLLKLGPEARLALQNGQIEMGHARALLNMPADQQADAARIVVENNYTVRATEQLVARLLQKNDYDVT